VIAADEESIVSVTSVSATMASDIAIAAYGSCLERGYHVAAAVVGRDGRLLSVVRSPRSGPHTIEVARKKAYAANTFRTKTSQLMGNEFMRDIPGVLIIGGAIPIEAGGRYFGAVAVSGAPAIKNPGDVDEECAQDGLNAVQDDLEMSVD
jgi:uncharacterized protein GlcG (DUF336 family)